MGKAPRSAKKRKSGKTRINQRPNIFCGGCGSVRRGCPAGVPFQDVYEARAVYEGVWGPITQKRARCICPLARLGVRAIFHPSSCDWSLPLVFAGSGVGGSRWPPTAGSSEKANAFSRVSTRTLLFGVMRRVVVRRRRLVGAQFTRNLRPPRRVPSRDLFSDLGAAPSGSALLSTPGQPRQSPSAKLGAFPAYNSSVARVSLAPVTA